MARKYKKPETVTAVQPDDELSRSDWLLLYGLIKFAAKRADHSDVGRHLTALYDKAIAADPQSQETLLPMIEAHHKQVAQALRLHIKPS